MRSLNSLTLVWILPGIRAVSKNLSYSEHTFRLKSYTVNQKQIFSLHYWLFFCTNFAFVVLTLPSGL